MSETTRRGAIATVGAGAVALTGTAAALAFAATMENDPALQVAAEWTAARDRLSALLENTCREAEFERLWGADVLVLSEAGYRLGEVQATTLVGAVAVLAVAVKSLEPSNLTILHSNLGSHRVMLAWLRSAYAAIDGLISGDGS